MSEVSPSSSFILPDGHLAKSGMSRLQRSLAFLSDSVCRNFAVAVWLCVLTSSLHKTKWQVARDDRSNAKNAHRIYKNSLYCRPTAYSNDGNNPVRLPDMPYTK